MSDGEEVEFQIVNVNRADIEDHDAAREIRPRLLILDGVVVPPEPADFVCPWCAKKFVTRANLDQHWLDSPSCRRNRGVNNPTTEKYHNWGEDTEA